MGSRLGLCSGAGMNDMGRMQQDHAHEGFCEDLARQNAVAHLSQLQLRFRRRHIWVSMLSHMGFSHGRGVLKATI
jgi:hypothetical protein